VYCVNNGTFSIYEYTDNSVYFSNNLIDISTLVTVRVGYTRLWSYEKCVYKLDRVLFTRMYRLYRVTAVFVILHIQKLARPPRLVLNYSSYGDSQASFS